MSANIATKSTKTTRVYDENGTISYSLLYEAINKGCVSFAFDIKLRTYVCNILQWKLRLPTLPALSNAEDLFKAVCDTLFRNMNSSMRRNIIYQLCAAMGKTTHLVAYDIVGEPGIGEVPNNVQHVPYLRDAKGDGMDDEMVREWLSNTFGCSCDDFKIAIEIEEELQPVRIYEAGQSIPRNLIRWAINKGLITFGFDPVQNNHMCYILNNWKIRLSAMPVGLNINRVCNAICNQLQKEVRCGDLLCDLVYNLCVALGKPTNLVAYDIRWDVDEGEAPSDTQLVPYFQEDKDGYLDMEATSDWLSEEFEFCHNGFNLAVEVGA